jgi:hypothetical protein
VAHSRQETRHYWLIGDYSYLRTTDCKVDSWEKLAAIAVADSTTLTQGKEIKDRRFFLTSLHNSAATLFDITESIDVLTTSNIPARCHLSSRAQSYTQRFCCSNLEALRRSGLNLLKLDVTPSGLNASRFS